MGILNPIRNKNEETFIPGGEELEPLVSRATATAVLLLSRRMSLRAKLPTTTVELWKITVIYTSWVSQVTAR